MSVRQTFRVAAVCWAIYALVTTFPVLAYPSHLAPATIRAGFGLLLAWFFWSRPGRGIAVVGTVLGFFFIPLAFLAVAKLSIVGPINLVVAAVGVLVFITSGYCWMQTTGRGQRST